jgi:hypothetical protein
VESLVYYIYTLMWVFSSSSSSIGGTPSFL